MRSSSIVQYEYFTIKRKGKELAESILLDSRYKKEKLKESWGEEIIDR